MYAFSLALGQQCCFYLSFRRLLAAVRQCVTIVGESSNDAYLLLAAAIGAGVKCMQVSIDHKTYECLRWRQGARDCKFSPVGHTLIAAAVRPADAQYLVSLAAAEGLRLEELLPRFPELLLDAKYVEGRAKTAEPPAVRRARLVRQEEGREARLQVQAARQVARKEELAALRAALLLKTVAGFDLREDKAREWREAKARDEAREAKASEAEKAAEKAAKKAKAEKAKAEKAAAEKAEKAEKGRASPYTYSSSTSKFIMGHVGAYRLLASSSRVRLATEILQDLRGTPELSEHLNEGLTEAIIMVKLANTLKVENRAARTAARATAGGAEEGEAVAE